MIALFRTGVLVLLAALVASPASAFDTIAREALLIDATTRAVLFDKNADAPTHPASMTKIMTAYLLFERIKDGRVKLTDSFPVSEKAWRMQGSKSWVKVGDSVKVEDLIRGMIVQSGNDASIVIAEGLAGSEEEFAHQMTEKARALGMTSTTFRNATGWPDPDHLTTARDLVTLSLRTIRDFPEYYHYFSEREFAYGEIKQGNRNPLLYRAGSGVDGLKTGHTEEAGYGLAASADRQGRRLILVLGGLKSMQERADETQRLLDYGFRETENITVFKAGAAVESAEVWLGDAPSVTLTTAEDITLTLPRGTRREVKASVTYDGPVPAPIAKGQQIAKLTVVAGSLPPFEVPLIAAEERRRLGLIGRIGAALRVRVLGLSP